MFVQSFQDSKLHIDPWYEKYSMTRAQKYQLNNLTGNHMFGANLKLLPFNLLREPLTPEQQQTLSEEERK